MWLGCYALIAETKNREETVIQIRSFTMSTFNNLQEAESFKPKRVTQILSGATKTNNMFEETSYVYCLWFVPFRDGDSFFAAMIRDEDGDRILYRFDAKSNLSYYMMERGGRTIEDFKRRFNRTVEEFSDATRSPMEYLPVESGIERALEILEEQPWGSQILPA